MVNGPQGTMVDFSLLERQVAAIKVKIQRNDMTATKGLMTAWLADATSVNVLVQAATNSYDLPSNPTLSDPNVT